MKEEKLERINAALRGTKAFRNFKVERTRWHFSFKIKKTAFNGSETVVGSISIHEKQVSINANPALRMKLEKLLA